MIRVARLSIAPVRGLGLEHPEVVELTATGVLEDRRFYVIDDDGRLVDQLIAGRLVQVKAHTDPAATTLRLAFPGGTVIDAPVELGEAVETHVHGRTAVGHRVIGPWAAALEPFAGEPVHLARCDRPGGTRIANAVSLISDGSLEELARRLDRSFIDGRRFRMLVEVEGAAAHEEDDWIGGRIGIGTAVLAITRPDARCAITTHDPDTGVRDVDTLRGIIGYRGLRDGRKADFGILGEVDSPGRIRVGDEVVVLGAVGVRVPAPIGGGTPEVSPTALA
ncbi:MAG TPA: MOSC N-terminal beta barrel domain-containing protein [Candidatus Eisenbacteria bacterium]|nr:MOSC N-terminal beta barrel domain-containing protein [Candidatus Eisenbacteria bacterium]